jgi:hypothetical protein
VNIDDALCVLPTDEALMIAAIHYSVKPCDRKYKKPLRYYVLIPGGRIEFDMEWKTI